MPPRLHSMMPLLTNGTAAVASAAPLGQGFGEQRDPDHRFGAGAEPDDKPVNRKIENALREALQCGENAIERNAQGERTHPADIVGEDAEQKPDKSPTQQPRHAEE